VKGVEHRIDHVALARLAAAALADRLADRGGDGHGNVLGQCAMEAGDRPEMVEQIGVGAPDTRRDRLQRHRRYPLVTQQPARRRDRCRPAFVGRQAFADL
jgi:hypothetical protein